MKSARCALGLSLSVAAAGTSLSCINDSGKHVDYSYSFKYPRGFEYAYMDAHTKLHKSAKEMDTAHSSVTETIMQMHHSGVSYVMWNDEPPKGNPSAAPNAHSQGLPEARSPVQDHSSNYLCFTFRQQSEEGVR